MISTKEICNSSLGTKLVAFFNAKEISGGYFAIVSEYRKSIFSNASLDHAGTARRLSEKYELNFLFVSKTRIECRVKPMSKETIDEFLAKLYVSIVEELSSNGKSKDQDREIAIAMLALRGSPDGGSYYAVDARSGSTVHDSQVESLIAEHTSLAMVWNYNRRPPRSDKANQIRIKIDWVKSHLLDDLASINPYKCSVLKAMAR